MRPTLPSDAPGLLRVYHHAMTGLAPLIWWREARLMKRHRLHPLRMHERLGHASIARPPGRLIWLHGPDHDSAGSLLSLAHALATQAPARDLQLLLTTRSVPAADSLTPRLPPGGTHQFTPLDCPGPVRRFLDVWRPDIAAFIEGELWPNKMIMAHAAGAKLALINPRMPRASIDGWQKVPKTCAYLLGRCALITANTQAERSALISIGAAQDRLRLRTMPAQPSRDARATVGPRGTPPETLHSKEHILAADLLSLF